MVGGPGTHVVTFAEAARACCLAWGRPTTGYRNREADEHPAYVALCWRIGDAAEVELHDETPGLEADVDVYVLVWRFGGSAPACEEWTLHGTVGDNGVLTPLAEIVGVVERWLRDGGVEMPRAEPYDADDIEWRVNS